MLEVTKEGIQVICKKTGKNGVSGQTWNLESVDIFICVLLALALHIPYCFEDTVLDPDCEDGKRVNISNLPAYVSKLVSPGINF